MDGTETAVELLARQLGGAMYPQLNDEAQETIRQGARKLLADIDYARTVGEQRLAEYLAKHPGGPCGNCGASWENCTEKVLIRAGACCGRCRLTDTHGADAAEAELRRSRRQPEEVTVATSLLNDLAARLGILDDHEVAAVAAELRQLAEGKQ